MKNIWSVKLHLKTLQRVKVGDRLVFYVKQIHDRMKLPPMLVGVLEVISESFKNEKQRVEFLEAARGKLTVNSARYGVEGLQDDGVVGSVWGGYLLGQ